MAIAVKLVARRQRHLKWRALDGLELALMVLCGILLFSFCTTVTFDIITRTIGAPWLWLQEVTSTLFIYAIFFGASVATRRNDHLYLTAIAEALDGRARLVVEMIIRVLPDVAGKISEPLSKMEKMIIINSGNGVNGGGASKLTGDVTQIVAQLPPIIESLTGLKLEQLLQQVPGLRSGITPIITDVKKEKL